MFELPERMGSAHKAWAPYQAFEASDGWVLIAVASDEMWLNLCKVLKLEDLGNDSRYATPRRSLVESTGRNSRSH